MQQESIDFDGPCYNPDHDWRRLTTQLFRVFDVMKDEAWRTLEEISRVTGDPAASVSAQLRHLRKPRFGEFVIEKRRRGDPGIGLWEYRLQDPIGDKERYATP